MSNPQYTKHTTHTDALDTLGEVIDDTQKRDAIHLAVEPTVAAERLLPGDHVTVDGYRAKVGQGVGIVDPFLEGPVQVGQRFWLVVYPRQISSLRHVWEHPNFPASGETEVAPAIPKVLSERDAAKERLYAWGNNYFGYDDPSDEYGDFTFESFIHDLSDPYDHGYVIIRGRSVHGDSIPDHIWDDLETYLGRTVVRASSMGCSC